MSAPVAADVHIALRDGSTARVRPVVARRRARAARRSSAGCRENSRWLRFFSLGVNLDKAARGRRRGRPARGLRADRHHRRRGARRRARGLRARAAGPRRGRVRGRRRDAGPRAGDRADRAPRAGRLRPRRHDLHRDRPAREPAHDQRLPRVRASRSQVRASPDGIELEFPTELGEDARRKFEDRDRVAAVAAVERVLRPRSVAVIGASRRPDSFGGAAFRHAARQRLPRRALPGQPERGLRRQPPREPSVATRPGPVDLAIVAVPAERVPGRGARVRARRASPRWS